MYLVYNPVFPGFSEVPNPSGSYPPPYNKKTILEIVFFIVRWGTLTLRFLQFQPTIRCGLSSYLIGFHCVSLKIPATGGLLRRRLRTHQPLPPPFNRWLFYLFLNAPTSSIRPISKIGESLTITELLKLFSLKSSYYFSGG